VTEEQYHEAEATDGGQPKSEGVELAPEPQAGDRAEPEGAEAGHMEAEEVQVAEEEGEAAEELASVRQELEETKARETEYLDGWQRARAELANARKRFQREQSQAYTNAKVSIFANLLPIIDDFERALETIPDDPSNETWIEGVKLVQHKFRRLLEQEGVEPIEAAGREFDPFFHEAITHEPSETVPVGHVIGELQKGYRLGDRVVRPSAVRVSAGPPPEPEPAGVETGKDDAATTNGAE
jgi:molecular chaperone GrpE